MKKSYRFLVSALFLGALLLSACSGALPQSNGVPQSGTGSSQSTEAVFTGTVESNSGTFWLISGQQVDVDASTVIDPNIKVGDIVKVEASVSGDGAVVALKIESSVPDDAGVNDNSTNGNDDNSNDGNVNTNDNTNSSDDNSNSANDNTSVNDNTNSAPSGTGQEAFGVVESITADSITIGGITYGIASFTEFKNLIAVGDQVKIHVIVNADGTLTIREIEKSAGTGIGADNSNDDNSNFNGNDNDDDNSNDSDDDDNSNSNSNDDDDHDDNSNSNSNDNNDDDGNSNDD